MVELIAETDLMKRTVGLFLPVQGVVGPVAVVGGGVVGSTVEYNSQADFILLIFTIIHTKHSVTYRASHLT